MRRAELIEGIIQVQLALRSSNIGEAIRRYRSSVRGSESASQEAMALLLKAFRDYSLNAQNYSHAASRVANILKLDYLVDPEIWSRALFGKEPTPLLLRLMQDVEFAQTHLTKFTELLKQPVPEQVSGRDQGQKAYETLTIIVPEEEGQFSKPERLIAILESIQTLYEVCARINGNATNGLLVIACDSGSDKSFIFAGVKDAVKCVKDVINQYWKRAIFYEELQVAQRIEVVKEVLPVLEGIAELERSNSVTREEAESLKRSVLHSVQGLMEAGVITPEMEGKARYNPRQLLAPSPKLLSPPAGKLPPAKGDKYPEVESGTDITEQTNSDNSGQANVDIDSLSEAEQEQLLRLLLNKSRRNGQGLDDEDNQVDQSDEQ